MSETDAPKEPKFHRIAGRLCLDFANTVDWHSSANPQEALVSTEVLLAFGRQTGVIDARESAHIQEVLRANPGSANADFQEAVAVREAIFRVFTELSRRRSPQDTDLKLLVSIRATAVANQQLERDDEVFGLTFDDSIGLKLIYWPLVLDAIELLTSPELAHVHECASPDGCGWLFLDTSRNRRRRWCSMEGCGNRYKVAKHRKKVHWS